MTEQLRFPSATTLLSWSDSDELIRLFDDTIMVEKDGLYHCFTLTEAHYYELIMSTERDMREVPPEVLDVLE